MADKLTPPKRGRAMGRAPKPHGALRRDAQKTEARRETIRRLLHGRRVATQEELRQLLAHERFAVTQATLSRDLSRLGARRVSLQGGGTAYETAEMPASAGARDLELLREMVISVADNGSLVVIHTRPGAASAVARALDEARLPGSLGTLAGDDTIFLAPAAPSRTHQLTAQLCRLWQRTDPRKRGT